MSVVWGKCIRVNSSGTDAFNKNTAGSIPMKQETKLNKINIVEVSEARLHYGRSGRRILQAD